MIGAMAMDLATRSTSAIMVRFPRQTSIMSTPAPIIWKILPEEVQAFLKRRFDAAWDRAANAVWNAEVQSQIQSSFGYHLQMYWLGRSDKLSPQDLPILAWVTQTLVPADILAMGPGEVYDKPGRHDVLFAEAPHPVLAQQITQALIESYAEHEKLGSPPKPNFWKRWRR